MQPPALSSHHPYNVDNNKIDALGEFIQLDTNCYIDHGTWDYLFHNRKGRSNFPRTLRYLRHKAAPLLNRYARQGVPVLLSTEPWTLSQKDKAMERGNHPSAQAFTEFLRTEMGDMRAKGMFVVIPYSLVRKLRPLRISPLGCVPQRGRRPRMINDYTFSGVNPATVKMAPPEAMQWGRTINRVLWYIYTADQRQGPVLLSKTDLSDGFYQIPLTPSGALKLAVPFPSLPGEPPLVAIPTRLPMGWTESPPAFSAATETVADLINYDIAASIDMPPPHHLESKASTYFPPTPTAPDPFPLKEAGPMRPKLAYVDVYVDDFVKLVQGWYNATRVRRHTFHNIDKMFRPNDALDVNRKQPISESKLGKGDDHWSTQKVILGWLIDTVAMTISLPPHRQERLLTILGTIIKRRRASVQEWHQLLGELRSMSLAVPGSRGCFSFLQHALRPGAKRITITQSIRDQLMDFLHLAEDVIARPTHIAEVVPTPPTYYGAVDAAKSGMGGVWFPPGPPAPNSIQPLKSHALQSPILWRSPFPDYIQQLLVSTGNPTGTVTNSDLELAGTIAHDDVLANTTSVAHLSTCGLTDNTPSMSWRRKGSTTTTGPAAYLLQVSSLHQRHFRYKPDVHYISGPANAMADDCSRKWNFTDAQLLTYFNLRYPQTVSWQLRHLRPAMNSALISALLRKRSEPESYLPEIEKQRRHGTPGVRFVNPLMRTQTFPRWPTLSYSSRPLALDGEMAGSHPAASRIELAQWRMPSGLSARNFPVWGPQTLV